MDRLKKKKAGGENMNNINEAYRDFNDIMVKNSNFSERSDYHKLKNNL